MPIKYDTGRFPPAPILEIRLGAPQESAHHQVYSALIDTGSDFTLVPLDLLLQVDAPESRSAQFRGLLSEP